MRVRRWKRQPCFYGDCGDSEASNVGAVRLGEMGASNDTTAAAALKLYRENLLIRGYPTALPLTKSR